MRRILLFETTIFTGATRVTRTINKKVHCHFDTATVVVDVSENIANQIEAAIIKEHPDILFSSFSVLNPDVITIGKEKDLTVVVRQDYKLKDLPEIVRKRVLDTYPKADWVIAQTMEMKKELQSYEDLRKSRIKIIENPLDEEDILQKASMPNPFENNGFFHFLWVGRKDPIKDMPTLKKAFQIVHKQYPMTDLTLVSDDPNPFRWMKNADCLVISSVSEASPNVLREALFLGVEVISTDCSPTVRKLLGAEKIARVHNAESLAAVMLQELN